jgi:hypothetical protein
MRLGTIKNELGKWQYQVICDSHSPHRLGFNPYVAIWVVKFNKLLVASSPVTKNDYDGFIFSLRTPIFAGTMHTRTFRILDWLKWDTQGVPSWIPIRILMQDYWRGRHAQQPRVWLVSLLTHRFFITYPTKIKFI